MARFQTPMPQQERLYPGIRPPAFATRRRTPRGGIGLLLAALLLAGCAGNGSSDPAPGNKPPRPPPVDYSATVQPLLNAECGACHGIPPRGGLGLTTHPDLLAGGDSGAAVVPRDSASSLLITRLEGGHLAAQGRPDLATADLDTLKTWIDEGARLGPSDSQPPAFGGLRSASPVGSDSIQITWLGAVDGVSPAPALSYRVYLGNSLSDVNARLASDSPVQVVSSGNDFVTVAGLASGQTYFFAVRAQDAAGNRDTNSMVASATTFGTLPPVIYLTEIQPIFDANCIHCHSDANKAAGLFARLSLESYAQVLAGGVTGGEVLAGDPDGSLLVQMITGTAPGRPRMPFDNPGYFDTPRGQIDLALIRRWIAEGALNLPPGGGTDTTPPTFAGATGATGDAFDRATVSWSAATDNATPAGGIRYDVYLATVSGGQDYAMPPAGTVTGATSLQITGLSASTTYFFVVRASDAAGNGEANTVEVSATTPAAADTTPPAFPGDDPSLASPGKSSTTVDLTWVAATDNQTPRGSLLYRIYLAQTSGGQNLAGPPADTFTGVTSGQVAGLSPDTTYFLVIRAEDASGNRDANTAELGPITTDPAAGDPVAPTFGGAIAAGPNAFDAVSGTGGALLSWDPGSDNVTVPANLVYDVYQSTTSPLTNFATPDFTTAAGAGSFQVSGLSPDQPYYFVVRARDEAGNRDGNTVEVMARIGVDYESQIGTPILGPAGASCTACHGGAAPQNGVSFDTYLDTVNAIGSSGTREVTPFDGAGSLIYQKTGPSPPFGSRMPFSDPGYFDANPDQHERIRRWIDQGAPEFPDVTPPVFPGALSATPVSTTALQVDWAAATDDSSWPGFSAPIFYNLYVATASGAQDFRSPSTVANAGSATAMVTGLAPDTLYFIVVRAVDPSGNEETNTVEVSARTNAAGGDVTPPVFAGLTTATAASPTRIDLSWSAASDDTTPSSLLVYDVYRALAPGGQDFLAPPLFSTPPGATSFADTTVASSTAYFYVVRARDEAGNRDANTVERSATTPILDVTPPTFTGVTSAAPSGTTSITLGWSAATDDVTVTGAIVYRVYRALTPGGQSFTTPTHVTSAGVTTFEATGLIPDTTYHFVVRAVDEAGNEDSNTVELSSTTDPVPPPAPGVGVDYASQISPIFNKCVSCHGGTMGFFFETYASIESSAIGQPSSFGLNEIERFASDDSYLIWKIEGRPGMTGDRMPRGGPFLSAPEIQLMTDWINQGVLEVPDTTAPAFGGATAAAAAGPGRIQIDWTGATDAAGLTTGGAPIDTPPALIVYNIYESVGGPVTDFTTPAHVAPAGSTSFTVTGLLPNTTYFHVVRAVDVTGNIDGNTVQVSATTSATADTTPPVFAGATGATPAGNASITISWSPATDDISPQGSILYDIWQSTVSPIGSFPRPSTYTSAPGATSFTATGLAPGQTYFFVVRARDEAGNQDTNTVEVSATTTNDSVPPTFGGIGDVATIDSSSLLVTWTAATDDQTPQGQIVYHLYMRLDAGSHDFSTPSYVSSPGATSHLATGLAPDTRYFFVVRARDLAGNEDTNLREDKADTEP